MSASSPPDATGDGPPARLAAPGREVSPLDVFVRLVRERGLFLLVALPIAGLGIAYALTLPTRYTAEATVVREAGPERASLPGSLSSLPGLSVDIGGDRGSGLAPGAYPKILTSREVRLAVARDTFFFPQTGRRTTFVAHVNRPPGLGERLYDFTLGLPWTLADGLTTILGAESSPPVFDLSDPEVPLIVPTPAEQEALDVLDDAVAATGSGNGTLDQGTGLMTITTTATDPRLAARLNQRFIVHLRDRIRELRTQKTREHLAFVRQRLSNADQELTRAEDSLAQFLERNRSVIAGGGVPTLSFRRDRLQRQVRFKEQLYGHLQEQVTQARLRLQRQQPVITVAEQASPPSKPSGPNRLLLVVLSVLLGGIGGGLAVYVRSLRTSVEADEAGQKKLLKIRRGLTVRGLVQGVRAELGRGRAPPRTDE